MTCLYLLLFKKKKKDLYASMGKKSKLCHNCPAIYLFFWEGEGNPYISNPVNTLKKSSKVHLLTLKSQQRTCLDLQCVGKSQCTITLLFCFEHLCVLKARQRFNMYSLPDMNPGPGKTAIEVKSAVHI